MSEAVLRELGAEARTFKTIDEALTFYSDRMAMAMSMSVPLEASSAPRNQQKLDETQATLARIAFCLRERDPEVDDCVLRHVGKILDWHRGWVDPETLAKLWGFRGQGELHSAMIEVEMFLRHRMRARGLLQSG